MSDIEDVLVHAWNKDAVNLAPALDNIMSSKAADAIQGMYSSVAASLFGQEAPIQPESQDDLSTDQTHEEPVDVNSEQN